ncbi:MAG: biopolymer transport protein [SAR86 cluster bacterium SAR86B]|uniref:Biopolymer transport protein n=1 Tax=SAR86 cluster bacterium SAR86B TaxID=1123867 RepID=J4V2A2_9GAMM|nr:MAG: biopolymer transport protein [SAR86 cluster bacterium SAR86B]
MKNYLYTILIIAPFLYAQEEAPVDPNEERIQTIQELLQKVENNKSIYVNEDAERIENFLSLVSERKSLLADAKEQLRKEKIRNTNLESRFENNEKELADLQERLQIKIGVLGELFGVARQFAGELYASTENGFTFYEFPERPSKLEIIGQTQVHNITQLETLWISYLNEIAASGEIKKVKTNIIDPKGNSYEDEIVRYGLFSASIGNSFVTPASDLNGFQLLKRQPERSVIKSLKRYPNSDDYTNVSIDPTRGFLLSLYLDKAGWFERIAQGKAIGFVIILIGLTGLAFSIYKIRFLLINQEELESDGDNVVNQMIQKTKDVSNYESKENILDELILNYSSKIEWGVSWVKFFAAVAPLLGLLGTVIGMIETFQAITLFGTGDPKQMAGGISQALVTTMLGLIVAAPLLGFYTYISDKASSLIQTVEEKASYLLAK